jgi:hypothetical protein
MLSRIVAVTNALAFIITTLFLLLAVGLLVTAPGGHRAIPELTLLGVALIAFLVAALFTTLAEQRAQAAPAAEPVEIRIEQRQVELMANVVDALVEAHKPALLKPIPRVADREPVKVAETRLPLPKHRAKA